MSPFSFSLSHTLTVFFSISSDCTSQLKLSFSVFCSLWNSHHNGRMALCFCFSFLQGRMTFASFFSFSSTRPTRLMQCPRNGMLTLEALHHFSLREVRPSKLWSCLTLTLMWYQNHSLPKILTCLYVWFRFYIVNVVYFH